MNYNCDVCIVGAGPGGALLGYLLGRQGISTILIERHEGIDKEFRGEHLNQIGEEILKNHQLYEKVEEAGLLLMERIEYWERGQIFKTINLNDGERHFGIHIPQKNLLTVLINEANKFESFNLMMGTNATALLHNEDGAITGVEASHDQQEITINSKITVGADGRFSTVRKLANIPFKMSSHGYDLLWAKIPSPNGWEPTIKQTLIDNKQLALFTQAGGFIQIGWNIEEGSYTALKQQPFQLFIKQVIDAFPELSDVISSHIKSWDDFILLNVQSCRCETWVQDGLIIIGDAAHTMSPTGAFGINSALKDADTVQEIISEALKLKDYSMKELKKFEDRRRETIEKLQKEQIEHEEAYKYNFSII